MESLQSSVVSLCVHMHVHTRGRKVGEKVMVVVGVWGVGWGGCALNDQAKGQTASYD